MYENQVTNIGLKIQPYMPDFLIMTIFQIIL